MRRLSRDLSRELMLRAHGMLVRGSYYAGITRRLLRHGSGLGRCRILLYHEVDSPSGDGFDSTRGRSVPPAEFRRQMSFLQQHFHILPLRQLVSHVETATPFPPSSVVVTFDDGYRNVLSQASPILHELGIPFSVFVATGYVENQRTPWWYQLRRTLAHSHENVVLDLGPVRGRYDLARVAEKRRLYADVRRRILACPLDEGALLDRLQERLLDRPLETPRDLFLSWEELRRLAESPLVEIGSHSVSHASLAHLEPDALQREVRDSGDVLQARLGKRVEFFAYPHGEAADYSAEVIETVKEFGYRCGLAGVQGSVECTDEPFRLKRISISGQDDWPRFIGKLAGVDALLRSVGKAVYSSRSR